MLPSSGNFSAIRRSASTAASTSFPITSLTRSSPSGGSTVPNQAPVIVLRTQCRKVGMTRSTQTVSSHPTSTHAQSPTTFLHGASVRTRSEEHTSELQSRENLVFRLLLEKKKTIRQDSNRVIDVAAPDSTNLLAR